MAHHDILLRFQASKRLYEAVGFLCDEEKSITGDEMLDRTAIENGGAIGDREWNYLFLNTESIPEMLRPYMLATKVFTTDDLDEVAFLYWNGQRWKMETDRLDNQWGLKCLVLRRVKM